MPQDDVDAPRLARRVGIVATGIVAVSFWIVLLLGALAVVTRFVRIIVVPRAKRTEPVRVRRVDLDRGEIEFDADDDSRMPGRYSLWFDGDDGHARVGDITGGGAVTVTREILGVDFGDLTGVRRGRLGSWFYLAPAEFGHPYSDVTIETERGPAPAWLIPAEEPSDRWVVMVHGWGGRRPECLRAVETFHRAGYSCLVVSYRNDGEAPDSADGRYGLGDTEWRDVESALLFAKEHGAVGVVLAGWSMGGAIALQTVLRSGHAASVTGIMLDSPAVDWHDILAFQGTLNRLPEPITRTVVGTLGNGWGRTISGLAAPIDFTRLDVLRQADRLRVPIRILHSRDDGFVPHNGSARLAALRPDIVSYDEWGVARHARLWNYDSARWERSVGEWLSALDG
ncbi:MULTISPECIES: alpha/beta fold hydrolase [unclassified Leifsonia]|uniref:alpha/beta fold hydrolase n=1 Tax=unclassified Leifsonia TaxID=2663824 RepID=UPI0007021F6A|nr:MULTISPECIES: alpha/beta fold hydrolase [unclassified Leifsonia]KQX06757.1 hypothetical protein ASC59_02680 [Leifsonia sp. Root1293]KRA11042.1 hypothetical protein ASD61_02680 [Leifsonia sp. Root60]